MATTTVDIRDLSTRLAEVISQATAGAEVVVTNNDVPLAKLVPLPVGQTRTPGLHVGAMIATADFDEPLPSEFWVGSP